jgi:hypothetical protein
LLAGHLGQINRVLTSLFVNLKNGLTSTYNYVIQNAIVMYSMYMYLHLLYASPFFNHLNLKEIEFIVHIKGTVSWDIVFILEV